VLGVLENVEQMAFGHAGADLPFEIRQAVRLPGRPRLFQVGRAVGVERQLGVVGETGVHGGGGAGQLVLQPGDERLGAFRHVQEAAVGSGCGPGGPG
jgi:hypothetical protein